MKRRGWSTTDDAFDVRRKLAIAATIPLVIPSDWTPIMKPIGPLSGNPGYEYRKRMLIEGNVFLQIGWLDGTVRIVDPPDNRHRDPSTSVVDIPVPMRWGKRIDPIAAKKARKR